MTAKRFTILYGLDEDPFDWDILDNEKDAIICQYNGTPICELLNEQDQKIKELKRMLKLVSESESVRNENSVKEIVRNKLFGLDSVAGESANAFNDYLMLNKFFKEYYNEHWDNDKFD